MLGLFAAFVMPAYDSSQPRLLEFPPGYPATTKDRYEPSTAIKQFSTGRASVLGLSDDGKVWSWTGHTAVLVKSVHVDLEENKVLEVQSGWDRSSMYVEDVGIVYWSSKSDSDLVRGRRQQALEVADSILIDTVTIPSTSYRHQRSNKSRADGLGSQIGQVTHYVVLEAHIVFTTHLNKIFSYATDFPMSTLLRPEPVELTSFYDFPHTQPLQIRHLQGSFCNFAVFTASGAILTATTTLLDTFHQRAAAAATTTTTTTEDDSRSALPRPDLLPSLQTGTVMSLAFGDHHFHALHTDGTITSLGIDSRRCGALGLGSIEQSIFRGVHPPRNSWGDNRIPRETPQRRTVWFEPLMEAWLDHMTKKIKAPGSVESRETAVRLQRQDAATIEALGDYFEREGRKWEDGVTAPGEEMGGYFVLKVAAAGWHSAALVLVDDEKAKRARLNHMHHRRPTNPSPNPERERASRPPSLASNETIDSPGEQLAQAVATAFSWVWDLGRRFLGLKRREVLNASGNQGASNEEVEGSDDDGTAQAAAANRESG
ncbi:MAG: hypothetical protein Q9163_006491, partial [Psora crenata]